MGNEDFNLDLQNEDTEEFVVDFGEVIQTGGGGGTSNFNDLTNRPKYNGQTMTGSTNIPKVPAKTSDLNNDSDFQTGTQVQSAITTATSGKQDKLTAGTNIAIEDNVISATDTKYTAGTNITISDQNVISATGGGTTYTAGDNITIENDVISATDTTYTAGNNITISDQNVISATNTTYTAGTNVSISDENVISATDTTYSDFVGTDGNTGGTAGLVPAPATTDAGKFLKADGTWDTAGGGGGGVTVVQTTGTSQTDVMSQNATSSMVFADPGTDYKVKIGDGASATGTASVAVGRSAAATASNSVALGYGAAASYSNAIAIGRNAKSQGNTSICIGQSATTSTNNVTVVGPYATASGSYSVALGYGSTASAQGEVGIGLSQAYDNYGYNNSAYRLLTGVYDGQSAHDAVTVGQVNATIDAINTALNTSIPHIGAST